MTKARQLADLISSGSIETGEITSLDASKLTGTIADARVPASAVTQHANNYVHPNHTGEVTSTADGATVISNTAITGQTEKTSLADADKFLISDSADSNALKYVQKSNLPSGGLVPVRQSSGSSNTTNVIVNGWISDTYENYVMDYYFNVATNNEAISMTLYDSSGNISSGNNYEYGHIGIETDGSQLTLYNTGQNAWRLSHGCNNDSARVGVTGRLIWLHPRASGKRTTVLHHQRQLNNAATFQSFIGALEFKATNQLTGFYCNSTSGDISGWDINIYGIVNS